MYNLKPGIKKNSHRRWSLPDRIFFGYGACHILAGVYLDRPPLLGFFAEHVIPTGNYPGGHVFVTDGVIAFDYHGYSMREQLLKHHDRVWSSQHDGWACYVERVNFCLLSTSELNARKMLGPEQYLHDAVPRARNFIDQRDHLRAAEKARASLQSAQVRNASNQVKSDRQALHRFQTELQPPVHVERVAADGSQTVIETNNHPDRVRDIDPRGPSISMNSTVKCPWSCADTWHRAPNVA